MKKKGSAILIVIGAITVLMVLAYGFISSSRSKTKISKFLSDDKKAEAIAESASDFIIQYIKKNANKHETENETNNIQPIYYLLRAPLKAKSSNSNENIILDVSDTIAIDCDTDACIPFKEIVKASIDDMDWTDKVDVTSTCELCNAEAFTPAEDGYLVPTVNCEHLPAKGDSAKFLDEINLSPSSDNSTSDWKPSEWKLQVKFPSGNPTEESIKYKLDLDISFDIDLGIIDIEIDIGDIPLGNIKIKVSRDNEQSCKLQIKIDLDDIKNFEVAGIKPFESIIESIEDKITFDVDIQEKIDNSHFFPEIENKTLQGLKEAYTIGEMSYDFSGYSSKISTTKTDLNSKYSKCLNSFNMDSCSDFGDSTYYVEKGGILRITTIVKYSKTSNFEKPDITKTLVSEIPFKASDVQPMAPEYTFFIANSSNVGSVSDGHQLGKPFELNKLNSADAFYDDTPPAGSFIVHNVGTKNVDTGTSAGNKDKIDFSIFDNEDRVPGMVRINSDYSGSVDGVTQIRSFFGLAAQPELTEFNKFFTPFDLIDSSSKQNKFNTLISFCWESDESGDKTTPQRYHDLELPVIFDPENGSYKFEHFGTGVKEVVRILKDAGFKIVSVPTLLFGTCHMEYPLGLRVEGPVDSIYSRTRIYVKPKGEFMTHSPFFEDKTELYYDYENVSNYVQSADNAYAFDDSDKKENRDSSRAATSGMQKCQGYDVSGSWTPNDNGEAGFKYSPANCYDALQYAKKATKYYENASEFAKELVKTTDQGGFLKNGCVELNGVYYIKSGNLSLSSFKYKGNGLIVNKSGKIIIGGDIDRDDNESTLGIIARGNAIEFNASNVKAACFSNNAPMISTSEFKLEGNLVCNSFNREQSGIDTDIYYNNTICSVTPFASHRKLGKFEPKRYAVSFSDNWSKFEFEKMKN